MAETDSSSGESDGGTDTLIGTISPFQVGAVIGGLGLVGSYALSWVAVTGETRTERTGNISAGELDLVPELAALLGVVVILLGVLYWTARTQVVVLAVGLVTTGLALFGRFFLDSGTEAVRVGSRVGPRSSFEPGPGMTVTLVAALVLVAASFVSLLQAMPEREG